MCVYCICVIFHLFRLALALLSMNTGSVMEFICLNEAFIHEWNFMSIEITNQVRRKTTKKEKKTINGVLKANERKGESENLNGHSFDHSIL